MLFDYSKKYKISSIHFIIYILPDCLFLPFLYLCVFAATVAHTRRALALGVVGTCLHAIRGCAFCGPVA